MQPIRYQAARVELALNDRSGSKPEKLNESKCFPLFTQQRTSPDTSACPFRANSGSRGRGLLDQIAGAARRDGALLWKSCFAEAVDIDLR
jgi:hypothetical protein